MTHLNIQLGQNIEIVSTQLIKKLYETALAVPEPLEGEEDAAYMSGHLEVDNTYERYVKYLAGRVGFLGTRVNNAEGRFPDLTIDTTGDYYIEFEDPAMVTYLNSIGVGSADGITLGQAALASVVANSQNTTVTKFNELKYFTAITNSKGGFSGRLNGAVMFKDWTALQEVDLRNFTSIGHSTTVGWEDSFYGCTSLKTINTLDDSNNSKLKGIGFKAFYNCSNLEDIIGLSGEIDCYDLCFYNNTKLKNSNFANCTVNLHRVGSEGGNFLGCSALTNITVSGTLVPWWAFSNCTNLTNFIHTGQVTKIERNAFEHSGITHFNYDETTNTNDLSGITEVLGYVFKNCSALSGKLYMPDIQYVGTEAFLNCTSVVGDINLPSLTGGGTSIFLGCTGILTVSFLGSTITQIPNLAFRGCTSLTTVNIPNTVTLLGAGAFLSSGVTHINYNSATNTNDLSGITNIKASAFRYCSNLSEKLYAPDVLEVGEAAFQNCTGLIGDLSLPSLTSLVKSSFAGCTGITSVSNLGNISEIKTTNGGYSWGAFRDCTNLTEITWPTTLTSFDFNVFGSDTNVQKFIFPYGMTVNERMPGNAISKKVKYIQFPSTITHINCIEMNYYTTQNQVDMYIVVQATNIPTTGYTDNGNSYKGTYVGYPENSKWYVPDAKLNDYKAHADWAPFASSIYPISQLETDSPTWWAVYLANKDYGVPTS